MLILGTDHTALVFISHSTKSTWRELILVSYKITFAISVTEITYGCSSQVLEMVCKTKNKQKEHTMLILKHCVGPPASPKSCELCYQLLTESGTKQEVPS